MREEASHRHAVVSASCPRPKRLQGLEVTSPVDDLSPEDSFGAVYSLPRTCQGLSRKTSQPWSPSHPIKE